MTSRLNEQVVEEAVERLNPGVPQDAQTEAIRAIERLDAPSELLELGC